MADGNGSAPKESSLLQDLRADLMRGRIEDVYEFAGRRFRLHTLNDGEVVWRDQFISTASTLSLVSSQKACTVAAAISHINDQPTEALFDLPEDPQLKAFLQNNPEDRRSWLRERMFAFISEWPDVVVTDFFLFYKGLESRREEVIKNLKNLSKGTSSSTSNSTSSAADGPPAAVVRPTTTPGSSFDT